jgi:5-hydroxyisourate hydrolase-like protein (transthyretin family)
MRTTVPCPMCKCSLTFVATLPTLACPFCRATIKFPRGKIEAGEKVRCRQCQGTFTAESPPPLVRVYASALAECPACGIMLAIRQDLPPGKKVRCFHCRTKFVPKRDGARPEAALTAPSAPLRPAANATGPATVPLLPWLYPGAAPEPPLPPSRNGDDKPVAEAPEPAATEEQTIATSPAANTRLGNRASRSSITHLAAAAPNEVAVPDDDAPPAETAQADDEIDFFHLDEAPAPTAAKAPPAPVANRNVAPPSPEMPLTIRVSLSNQLLAQYQGAPESIPVEDEDDPGVPGEEPAQQIPGPLDPDAAPPSGVDAEQTLAELAAATEGPGPDSGEAGAPVEEPVASEKMDEADVLRPEPSEGGLATSGPLSMRSAAELEAADALLGDADRPDVVAMDDEEPIALDEGPQLQPAPRPAYTPPIPRPVATPTRKPDASDGGGLEIDFKKMLTYGGSILAIFLVGVGIYYLFAGGIGRPKLYPTKVEVFYLGKPLEGARVTLIPATKTKRKVVPTCKTDKDGLADLTTYAAGDGAPAGSYKVSIVCGAIEMDEYAELQKKHTPEEIKLISEERAEQDPLQGRYANQRGSGLVAEIPTPSGRLEFKLD